MAQKKNTPNKKSNIPHKDAPRKAIVSHTKSKKPEKKLEPAAKSVKNLKSEVVKDKATLVSKAVNKKNTVTKTVTKELAKEGQKSTPIVFSLDDVQSYLSSVKKDTEAPVVEKKKTAIPEGPTLKSKVETSEKRVFGAASLSDILGRSVSKKGELTPQKEYDETKVPSGLTKYYKRLIALYHELQHGSTANYAKDTIKETSNKDGSQDFADAALENVTLNFALNLVSNEKELLTEIEGAIDRIFDGTYGICEITGQKIPADRLLAVPFTRFSLEGQKKYEQDKRRQKSQSSESHLAEDAPIVFAEEDSEP